MQVDLPENIQVEVILQPVMGGRPLLLDCMHPNTTSQGQSI